LVQRNALLLSHDRFRADSERLEAAVKRALEKAATERRAREEKERLEAERRKTEAKERLEIEQTEKERVEHKPEAQAPSQVATVTPNPETTAAPAAPDRRVL
jgi:hypothetical protein